MSLSSTKRGDEENTPPSHEEEEWKERIAHLERELQLAKKQNQEKDELLVNQEAKLTEVIATTKKLSTLMTSRQASKQQQLEVAKEKLRLAEEKLKVSKAKYERLLTSLKLLVLSSEVDEDSILLADQTEECRTS